MGQTTGFLTKSLTATGFIAKRRFVVFGPADGTGAQASAATSFIAGVSSDIDTDVGQRASVFMGGNIADIEYGANVTRGQPLTADAQGRAIPATSAGQFIGGFAEVSGVLGTIGSCIVQPHIY